MQKTQAWPMRKLVSMIIIGGTLVWKKPKIDLFGCFVYLFEFSSLDCNLVFMYPKTQFSLPPSVILNRHPWTAVSRNEPHLVETPSPWKSYCAFVSIISVGEG